MVLTCKLGQPGSSKWRIFTLVGFLLIFHNAPVNSEANNLGLFGGGIWRPLPIIDKFMGIVPGGKEIMKDVGSLLDVFQVHTTTTTTTPAPTTTTQPPFRGPFGGMFQSFFRQILQPKPTQPPTTTTPAVPTPPGGRGLSGLVFNAENVMNNLIEIKDVAEFKNPHWVPGYAMKKVQDILKDLLAIKDIIQQRNLDGGLLKIVNNTRDIFKTLGELNDLIRSNAPGHILFLAFKANDLLKDLGALKDDFSIRLPPRTTPPPGINFQNLLFDKEGQQEIQDIANSTNIHGLKEVELIVTHFEKLITALLDIEAVLQKDHPNSKLLQFLGKLRVSMEDTLAKFKGMDRDTLIQAVQKIFPQASVAQLLGDLGRFLTNALPKDPIAQAIGTILQQEMVVNIIINNLSNLGIGVKVGNIKDSLVQTAETISDSFLKKDPSHSILHTIISLESRAVSFDNYLKLLDVMKEKIKFNMTGGNVLQQITSKMSQLFNDPDTYEFIKQTILQVLHLLPIDFLKNAADFMSSMKKDFYTGGPVRKFIFYGGPVRRFVFNGGPVRMMLRGEGPLAYVIKLIIRTIKSILFPGWFRKAQKNSR